jgi:hypothetical protein
MGARKTKNMSKTTAAKLVVIREVDKNERSEMAKTYGMPLPTY